MGDLSIRTNALIIIAITILICISAICATIIFTQNPSDMNNSTNNSTNITNNTTLNDSNSTNNTTDTQKSSTKKQSSTKKSSSSKNSGDGYHYSAQYGTYIKEWEDSEGSHMVSKDGDYEVHYNEKTGAYREKTPYDGWTSNQR